MDKVQFKKDYLYKNFSDVSRRKNNISLSAKYLDRLTHMRMKQALQGMNVRCSLIQKTSSTEEHIKEKKITKKETKLRTEISFQRQNETKELIFLFELKEIMKKKIYKQLSPILYISVPSFKILHQFNSRTLHLQESFLIRIN